MAKAICVKCDRVHNVPDNAYITRLCCGRKCRGRLKWAGRDAVNSKNKKRFNLKGAKKR